MLAPSPSSQVASPTACGSLAPAISATRIRVLVTGGRRYENRRAVAEALRALHRSHVIAQVIHGGASGADTLAAEWADFFGVDVVCIAADWATHGRAAGPMRNRAMLALHPDLVLAFPGGPGTEDMVRQAERAGIPVQRVGGC